MLLSTTAAANSDKQVPNSKLLIIVGHIHMYKLEYALNWQGRPINFLLNGKRIVSFTVSHSSSIFCISPLSFNRIENKWRYFRNFDGNGITSFLFSQDQKCTQFLQDDPPAINRLHLLVSKHTFA